MKRLLATMQLDLTVQPDADVAGCWWLNSTLCGWYDSL